LITNWPLGVIHILRTQGGEYLISAILRTGVCAGEGVSAKSMYASAIYNYGLWRAHYVSITLYYSHNSHPIQFHYIMKRLCAMILWQPFYATVDAASAEMCWDALNSGLAAFHVGWVAVACLAVSSVQQLSQSPQALSSDDLKFELTIQCLSLSVCLAVRVSYRRTVGSLPATCNTTAD